MKTALVLLISLTACGWAQSQQAEKTKRLQSVTWDLNTHKLVWVVETGSKVDGQFVPESTARYEVSPDDAVMSFADEQRGFDQDEAAQLHHLLDVLSIYCAESVVWWDQGQGVPLPAGNPPAKTAAPGKTIPPKTAVPDGKPVKVDRTQPAKPYHPAETDDIAMAGRH